MADPHLKVGGRVATIAGDGEIVRVLGDAVPPRAVVKLDTGAQQTFSTKWLLSIDILGRDPMHSLYSLSIVEWPALPPDEVAAVTPPPDLPRRIPPPLSCRL